MSRETRRRCSASRSIEGCTEFEDILLDYQAQAAAREGRLNESRSISKRAVEMAMDAKQPDHRVSLFGPGGLERCLGRKPDPSRQQAQKALQLSSGREGEAVAAVAFAVASDSAEALHLANDLAKRFPENTMVRDQYLPMIRAAAALHSGARVDDPNGILSELAVAAPTEFGSHAVDRVAFLTCYSIYFRGEAYLAARQEHRRPRSFKKSSIIHS